MSVKTPAELRASIELIESDVDLLRQVDSLLLSATLELAGGHTPIMETISRARREISTRVEQHNEAKGVIRTQLKRAERRGDV